MLSALFWLLVGFLLGINLDNYDSHLSRAWEWLKAKAKRLGIGRNGQ